MDPVLRTRKQKRCGLLRPVDLNHWDGVQTRFHSHPWSPTRRRCRSLPWATGWLWSSILRLTADFWHQDHAQLKSTKPVLRVLKYTAVEFWIIYPFCRKICEQRQKITKRSSALSLTTWCHETHPPWLSSGSSLPAVATWAATTWISQVSRRVRRSQEGSRDIVVAQPRTGMEMTVCRPSYPYQSHGDSFCNTQTTKWKYLLKAHNTRW